MGTLWHNAIFYTMEKEQETVKAVFVENGEIKALGLYDELEKRYRDEIIEKRDLKGGYVYPGFVDSHLHMLGHGEKLLRLDLSEIFSSQAMLEKIQKSVHDDSSWIIGEGWNENNFIDRKIFHREELDTISNDKPMYLSRICRHAALVNTEALHIAGITKETANPSGGVIVKDAEGEPTGLLLDEAVELVKKHMPKWDPKQLSNVLRTSIKDLHRVGLTGGHTEDLSYYGNPLETLRVFEEVIEHSHEHTFRAHLLVHHKALEQLKDDSLNQKRKYVEPGAMKFFTDGALGGRTALLSEPYTDDPSTSGVAIHEQSQVNQLVKYARERGLNIAAHVIGDAALEMTLNAIEVHPSLNGRDRLIHVQVLRKDLLERMKNLPIILDIQPRFVASDFPWVQERLGMERLPLSFAWKTLLKEGFMCAGGSDAPIEPADPLLGIHAAITRRKPEDGHQGYNPVERLTAFEAVQLFTAGSAFAISAEQTRGKIKEGYLADFTVLSKDILTVDPDEILETNVLYTIIDNKVVYHR
ncbi:putative hydrolase [Bacillus sp. TS-2]|nr:putative hydrolase [Bacillus sp. TS-2]